MKKHIFFFLILLSSPILADSKSDQVISKFRILSIFPDQRQKFNLPSSSNNNSVSKNRVFDRGFGAEISSTYFYNKNQALELAAGIYGQKFKNFQAVSELYGTQPAPNSKNKKSFIIPASIAFQYHINSDKEFSPYLGVGYHYGFSTHSTSMAKVSKQHGPLLQAGFDLFSKNNYGLNLDIKKYWTKANIKYSSPITNLPLKAKLKLDPIIIGFGISRKM